MVFQEVKLGELHSAFFDQVLSKFEIGPDSDDVVFFI